MQQRQHHVDLTEVGGHRGGPAEDERAAAGPRPTGVTDTPGVATASTDGGSSEFSASRAGSPEVSTHRPSRAMPIGTTSYLSLSMAPSTSPALAHDTACSALRPPNTTATRTLRCEPIHTPDAQSQLPVDPQMAAVDQWQSIARFSSRCAKPRLPAHYRS